MNGQKAMPPEVTAALNELSNVAKAHGVKIHDILGVTLVWATCEEVRRLRNLLDRLAPGWNDDI